MIFLLLLPLSGLMSQNSGDNAPLKIGGNYRIHPGKSYQTEVFIVKNPIDENVLFTACNTLNFVPFFISEGIYVTADGGSHWRGTDTCSGTPVDYHGGDVGITIDKNGTFILTRLGRTPFVGLYSHYSTDKGLTWSAQKVISTDDLERASLASDVNPASTHFGRSYASYVKFASPFPVVVAYTDNGGQQWSTPKQVNTPVHRCAGGDIAVGSSGTVYTCWAGVTDVSPFREIYAGFAASSNGGQTWNVNENIFAMSGISGVLEGKNNIRVNSLPSIAVDTTAGPHHGWIYIVTCQKNLAPAGSDPDIILNRSTDGGQTWSAGIRVNQDAMNNGKTQFFPSVHVDKTGSIDIIFYDDRTTTNDSAAVFLARSGDGGNTWREYEISDHHFQPKPIGGLGQGYQGDNIDITSTSTKLWPVWMDNSSGIYQVWTVPIDYADVNGTGDRSDPKNQLSLYATPNPFANTATITIQCTIKGEISLEIFDITGRKVSEILVDKPVEGRSTARFDGTALPSGVYFCKLTAGDATRVIKLVKI